MLDRTRPPGSPARFSNSSAGAVSLRVAMNVIAASSSSGSTGLSMRCSSPLRSISASHSRKSRQPTCSASFDGATGGEGWPTNCSMMGSGLADGAVDRSLPDFIVRKQLRRAGTAAQSVRYVSNPTIAPISRVASVPETIDFNPSERTSLLRSGASVVSPPIMMPTLPKLAKPHIA